jgi:4-hydroxybenzoate polyprenyltransferase
MKWQNNRFLLILLHNNLVLSLAAVLLCLVSQVQMGHSPDIYPYHGLIFGACLSEYNLHRFLKFYKLNFSEKQEKYKWLNVNQGITWSFTILSMLVLVVSFFFVDKGVKLIFLASAAIVILYSMPLSVWTGYLSIRKIPFLKTVFVALIWSVMTVLIPAAEVPGELSRNMVILNFIGRFLLIFPLALLFDIRDIKTDKENGISTIPSKFGRKITLQIVLASLIFFIAISYFSVETDLADYQFISALLVSILLLILIYVRSISSGPFYYSLFLDGTLIIYSVTMLAAWLFFYQK